jgi:hypothetical protein
MCRDHSLVLPIKRLLVLLPLPVALCICIGAAAAFSSLSEL